MKALIAWVMLYLCAVSAPGAKTYWPNAQETEAEARIRYAEIATDLLVVVWDSNEQPVFDGPHGRAKTMALMLGIMKHESGLRKDVDLQIGKDAFGDSGASVCLMQVRVGKGKTPEGWTREDLRDRKKCFRAGLRAIRESFKHCAYLPEAYRLSAYTGGLEVGTGKCLPNAAARIRYNSGVELYNDHTPSLKDQEIMDIIRSE